MLGAHTPTTQNLNSNCFLSKLKKIHSSEAYFLGNYAKQYEYELAQYFGSLYAVHTDSKIKSIVNVLKTYAPNADDEIICLSFGMSRTANALLQHKITPVFADLNKNSYTMSFEHCKQLVNSKTKAIVLSYPFGIPNESHLFKELANKHNILLLEDIQAAIGSSWRDQKLGSYGDVAFFNHHPKNILSYSQAGLCITDNTDIAKTIRKNVQQPYSVLQELSEFLGAIGLHEINQLEQKLLNLQKIHAIYSNYLSNVSAVDLYQDTSQSVAIKQYLPLRINSEDRNFFYNDLSKYCPFISKHFEAAHNNALINVMLRPPHLPNTDKITEETLLLKLDQEDTLIRHIDIAEKLQSLSENYKISA